MREVPAEQAASAAGTSYLLSVHGGDRPGIVSAVVAEVARVGGNITDLTTRLAGDLYVLIAEVDLPADADAAALERALGAAAADLGVDVTLRAAGDRRPVSRTDDRQPPGPRLDRGRLAWPASSSRSSAPLSRCCPPRRPRRPHRPRGRPARRRPGRHDAGLARAASASPHPRSGSGAKVFCVDVSEHPKTRGHHGTFVLCNAEVVSRQPQREGP